VLSNARLEDGMYVIPKGVAASFTLLVMYTIGEGETDTMFRNQVTHLPFTFDKTEQQKLNPSELQYYVTPLVALSNVTRVSVTGIDILVSGDSDPEDLNISAPNTTEVTVSN
jgi:hypothetical protein